MIEMFFGTNKLIIGNIICLIGIIITFFIAFKVDKQPLTTRKITAAGLLSSLAIIANMLSVSLYFFGAETVKVGFQLVILIIIGLVLSPKIAVTSGLVIDMVGLIIRPANIIFLGFTLTTILSALIPALLVYYFKTEKLSIKHMKLVVNIFIVSLAMIATIYVLTLNQINNNNVMITVTTGYKIMAFIAIVALLTLMYVIIFIVEKRFKQDEKKVKSFYENMFIVSVVLLIVSLMLTPIFLYVMYDIPIILNLLPRIFKDVILLPIYTVLVTLFLPVTLKLAKEA